MIGKCNTGGSGLGSNKPLIHVNAPIGSTIEIYFNNILLRRILSNASIPNIDGETADYYYSANMNGTWTVTATLGADTISDTVTIVDSKQYDVKLFLYCYDYVIDGELNQDVTTIAVKGVTIYRDDVPFNFRRAGNEIGIAMGQVDLTNYKTFVLDASYTSNQDWSYNNYTGAFFGFTESDLTWRNGSSGLSAYYNAGKKRYDRREMAIDVSNLTGLYYFRYCFWDGGSGQVNIYNMFLRG